MFASMALYISFSLNVVVVGVSCFESVAHIISIRIVKVWNPDMFACPPFQLLLYLNIWSFCS